MIDPAVGALLAGAFALLFASAALHKLVDLARFAEVFRAYAVVPAALARLAPFVPLLELTVAVALLAGGSRAGAAAAGAALLLVYASAIAINLARGRRDLTCGCGGPNDRRPIAAWMVWRNLILAGLLAVTLLPWTQRAMGAADALTIGAGTAVAALLYMSLDTLLGRVAPRAAGGVAGLAVSALAISNAVLWVLVLVLTAVVLALVRQLGVLHERIAPAGALMLNRGPAVGEPAPLMEVADLEGHAHQLGSARTDGRSTLLLFVSPSCPVCKTLLPAVKSSRKDERAWMDVILASDGDTLEQREFVRAQGLDGIPYVVSAALGLAYQVSRLPFAALLDEQGILRARGLVNSREHLESLFEAKRLGVASLQEYFSGAA